MITANVGIDLAMNSTGLTFIIHHPGEEKPLIKFIRLVSELVPNSPSCRLVTYKRDYRADNYSYRDLSYVNSAKSCAAKIYELMKNFAKIYDIEEYNVALEAPIMGRRANQSRINELVGYNTQCKTMLLHYNIVRSIAIIAPTTLKKIATGNGHAKKDAIEKVFYEEFPDYVQTGKNDDVADSYYLAKGPIPDDRIYFKT